MDDECDGDFPPCWSIHRSGILYITVLKSLNLQLAVFIFNDCGRVCAITVKAHGSEFLDDEHGRQSFVVVSVCVECSAVLCKGLEVIAKRGSANLHAIVIAGQKLGHQRAFASGRFLQVRMRTFCIWSSWAKGSGGLLWCTQLSGRDREEQQVEDERRQRNCFEHGGCGWGCEVLDTAVCGTEAKCCSDDGWSLSMNVSGLISSSWITVGQTGSCWGLGKEANYGDPRDWDNFYIGLTQRSGARCSGTLVCHWHIIYTKKEEAVGWGPWACQCASFLTTKEKFNFHTEPLTRSQWALLAKWIFHSKKSLLFRPNLIPTKFGSDISIEHETGNVATHWILRVLRSKCMFIDSVLTTVWSAAPSIFVHSCFHYHTPTTTYWSLRLPVLRVARKAYCHALLPQLLSVLAGSPDSLKPSKSGQARNLSYLEKYRPTWVECMLFLRRYPVQVQPWFDLACLACIVPVAQYITVHDEWIIHLYERANSEWHKIQF